MRSANGLAASTRLRDVDAVLAWLLAVVREPDANGVTSASDRARLPAVSDAACSDTRGGERAGSLDAPFYAVPLVGAGRGARLLVQEAAVEMRVELAERKLDLAAGAHDQLRRRAHRDSSVHQRRGNGKQEVESEKRREGERERRGMCNENLRPRPSDRHEGRTCTAAPHPFPSQRWISVQHYGLVRSSAVRPSVKEVCQCEEVLLLWTGCVPPPTGARLSVKEQKKEAVEPQPQPPLSGANGFRVQPAFDASRSRSLSNTIVILISLPPSCTMSGWQASHRHALTPRIDLGADEDDGLDYSAAAHAGPSHSSLRHHTNDPRSTRSNHIYHDLDQPNRPPPRPFGPPPLLARPSQPRAVSKPARTPSPEPDEDVLAYIRAQKQQQASSTHTQHELRLAQQLKRDKFQHGASRLKSRVDREREADERKRRQAEHDAQLAYHEFVAAMGGDGDDDVHLQRSQAGSSRAPAKKAAAFVAAGGKAYVGSRTAPKTIPDASDPEANFVSSAFGNESDDGITPTTPAQASSARNDAPKRKRHAMDTFLSELQTEQAERESRLADLASATNTSISTLLAHETQTRPRGSRHTGDTPTTNICIVNLPRVSTSVVWASSLQSGATWQPSRSCGLAKTFATRARSLPLSPS
ncbi:hypothetical protein L1887_62443 [Cichorium endivia]|nr:hypothetical protein L1887_62443 [Cichorium endivia]